MNIGLSLLGGGTAGLSLAGSVIALEENKIIIDGVSGAGLGAVIGVLLGCQFSGQEIAEFFINQAKERKTRNGLSAYLGIMNSKSMGLQRHKSFDRALKNLLEGRGGRYMSDAGKFIALISTDAHTGKSVVFTNKSSFFIKCPDVCYIQDVYLWDAALLSAVHPVTMGVGCLNDICLIDGRAAALGAPAVLNNAGAKRILAVYTNGTALPKDSCIKNSSQAINFILDRQSKLSCNGINSVLCVKSKYEEELTPDVVKNIIDRGYETTMNSIPRILEELYVS